MGIKFTDEEIESMIQARKPLPKDYSERLQLHNKRGHKERELDVQGVDGNQYSLILRQSDFNPLDFSVILAVTPAGSNKPFRLRRYNGHHGQHTNRIERETIDGYHIHNATERYQELGASEEGFAEPTKRYADFSTALHCMLTDCGFEHTPDEQNTLFKELDL